MRACTVGEARLAGVPAFQSCLPRAVRVPERFRGGLLLRRPGTSPGLSRRGSSALRSKVTTVLLPYAARPPPLGQLVSGVVGRDAVLDRRSFPRQLREGALDLAPDPAERDAEHALAALE